MVAFPRTLLSLSALLIDIASASRCSPASIEKPDLPGASILDIQAHEAHNYSAVSLGPGTNDGGHYTISFCNVTVTHTHPGWNDRIHTQIWLPLEGWNGRFQGLGGGGYSTGFGATYLTYAVAQGFASASTDGGLTTSDSSSTIPTDLSWALSSKGNVNWPLLNNYATKATNDMAVIGQQITKSYYNTAPKYSYFAGCSGGGRQALMMAQQYPDVFDGILAVAPAINIQTFIPAGYWPSQVMHDTDVYPSPCEVHAFTEAAGKACDRLDGVEDGIISLPARCSIKASDFIGKNYTCNGTQRTFTPSSAKVIDAAWSGSRSISEQYGWYGVNKDADISSYYIPTTCSTNFTCTSTGSDLFGTWIKYLVAQDPTFNLTNMTQPQFFHAMHSTIAAYTSILGTTDPNLTPFKSAGGKLIAWHGLADEVIPPNGTISYYQEVLKGDPHAHDFIRFFEAPGVGHCYGGLGPVPNSAMSQLMDWVENGNAPAVLHATKGYNETARDLCPYPLRQVYVGGDSRNATSFACA
ncbi:tannase and feruloyl esterase [Aspergillus ibericus CBS 121593]|uniref:Carboxylic ester hydrolase n=1 Tax=Aspergillus ibericus CBS 121593 TaxID=1448316 RepID=A0A395GMR8_9EURO|nr:tannase and feruloyl esterase [Aspergillus ibericus CBS 121593]RAK96258.1 tannase and feruloyl esterase [Aspergillus ibericus CBS 121593]